MERFKKILLVALLLTATHLHAQDFDKTRMDSLFSIIEQNNRGMGSVSLFHNGKEVYQRSYGKASIEEDIAADANTRYRVGSVSKMFTATLVMKLVENNLLTLNTSLEKFYPQVENSKSITIEDMLRHRSGIFNFTNKLEYQEYYTRAHSREELLQRILASKPAFEPQQKTEYSNANYVLLSFIAEDVSGKSYAQLLEEYITRPAGLKSTYVGSKTDVANHEARSYTNLSGWKVEAETHMSIPLGAGAIVSTPTELNVFINKLFAGEIVSNKSLEAMKTIINGFGLGMFQVPFHERRGLGHNGGIDGFQSSLFYIPSDNVSAAFTSNAVYYPMNDIMIGVLSIYFNKDYALPRFSEPLALSQEDMEPYVGEYASAQIPIKLKIFKGENALMAQGTNQPAFMLECFDKHKFRFDAARLEIEFMPEDDKLILKQGGGVFEMRKE